MYIEYYHKTLHIYQWLPNSVDSLISVEHSVHIWGGS